MSFWDVKIWAINSLKRPFHFLGLKIEKKKNVNFAFIYLNDYTFRNNLNSLQEQKPVGTLAKKRRRFLANTKCNIFPFLSAMIFLHSVRFFYILSD
jgi:hypothetical protein